MTWKVFSVYDSKVEAYLQPFFQRSRGEALRNFIAAVNDPQTMFNKHPEDYTLFEIGEFSEEKGEIRSNEVKTSLGVAIEFVKNSGGGLRPIGGEGKGEGDGKTHELRPQ